MKKGISLIVLVITIIVMIIIAGAIIISISNSKVIDNSQVAVLSSDLANLRSELTLKYADIKIQNNDDDTTNDIVKGDANTVGTATYMYTQILNRYVRLVDRGVTLTVADNLEYELHNYESLTTVSSATATN